MEIRKFLVLLACWWALPMFAQEHGESHGNSQTAAAQEHAATAAHENHDDAAHEGHVSCGESHHEEEAFNPSATAFHHIGDANAFHVWGDIYMPLPCILYAPDHGWSVFMSGKFDAKHHGNGEKAIDRYVMEHGQVMRVADPAFPMGEVNIGGFTHGEETIDGKKRDVYYVCYENQPYRLEKKSTLDAGVFGGGLTSYYDFSITKNVFGLLLTGILLLFMFRGVAKAYQRRDGEAPKGLQSLVEPVILFIRDEVAIPFIGKHKYEKYLPFLLSIFFLILGLNLVGQIPIFPGSSNVTGNLSFTLVMALFTFLVTNLNGNKHYWEHIFWMPGVPAWVKTILTPVEVMGIIIKPFTLMLRLFANITAGHIVIVSFVGLIFIFGKSGESIGGASLGAGMALLLSLFMMAIELLVAFIQAFVFTLLTASYIGSAVEDHHHAEEHH